MNEFINNYEYREIGIIAIAIAIAIKVIFRKRYEFKIKIQYKSIKIIYGKPPINFIEECKKAVLFHKPKKGYIYGIKKDGKIRIIFSSRFEEKKKQVFRNLWTEYPAIEKKDGKRKKG